MLSKIIDGQTIRIDNHYRGVELDSLKGVHIHKVMNSDKYRGAEILIPVGEDEDILFRKIKGGLDVEKRIRREIRKAFNTKHVRHDFIFSYFKSLNDMMSYVKIENEKEKYEIALKSALRIAEFFGVKPQVVDCIFEDANSFFKMSSANIEKFYVAQYPQIKSIAVGRELKDIKDMFKG